MTFTTMPSHARRLAGVLAIGIGLAVLAAPAQARAATPAPFDVATGAVGEPSMYVDPSGTAHLAWNETVPGGPDVLHYCRVLRGQRACTGSQTFVPAQDETRTGNGPAFNTQFAGLEIVPMGSQLVLLTHRYPNVVDKPDGSASSDATYAWTSSDGGQTFAGPGLVGDGRFSGGALAFGSGMIGTITDTTTGGTFFQAVTPGGYTGQQANLGDSGPDQAYDGSLAAVDATTPLAAFDDLANNTYVRQYSGAGDPNTAASWAPATVLPGNSEPHLASGPRGVFLITHADSGPASGTYVVRRYAGGALSSPVTVSPPAAIRRTLAQDAGGGLHVAWLDRTTTSEHAVIQARASADGIAWGPIATLGDIGTADANGLRIAGAPDGGGFVTWTSKTAAGQSAITVAPYSPDPAATVARQTAAVSSTGVTTLLVACHPPNPCVGSATLFPRAGGARVGRSATAAVARPVCGTCHTALATARFTLKAGTTGRVKLHLTRFAQRLLAKRHNRLSVTATVVTTTGGQRHTASGAVTLKRRGA